MSKRKRGAPPTESSGTNLSNGSVLKLPPTTPKPMLAPKSLSLRPKAIQDDGSNSIKLQIMTGSYEKVLHGFIASIPLTALRKGDRSSKESLEVKDEEKSSSDFKDLLLSTSFSDTFLFTAHTAPIRALAVSPPSNSSKGGTTAPGGEQNSKRILATAAPDEKINLYTLSSIFPKSAGAKPSNKHLGTLHEHTNTPTVLLFTPNRSKLISAGEDSQILIFRTRDWSLLSSLKAPKPKSAGPSVGLLGGGERPSGVNDLALHPSQKVLLSVSRRERCLRMWNMMTGRKAGVLGFTKEIMGPMGTRIAGIDGEGTKVRWSPGGGEFAVGFERGVIIFGIDSRPTLRILPNPVSKVHQIHYLTPEQASTAGLSPPTAKGKEAETNIIAIATEDGRILFYSTAPSPRKGVANGSSQDDSGEYNPNIDNPTLLGRIGGLEIGMVDRIKDFIVLEAPIPSESSTSVSSSATEEITEKAVFVVTASSSGIIRLWHIDSSAGSGEAALEADAAQASKKQKLDGQSTQKGRMTRSLGTLIGIYETGRRITCLGGMAMIDGQEAEEGDDVKESSDSESGSEEEEEDDE